MFTDIPLKPFGMKVTGLWVTQTGPLTLSVAAGSILVWDTGVVYDIDAETHTFTPDSSLWMPFHLGIITDAGSNRGLWVDVFADDGTLERDYPPTGFRQLIELAWALPGIAANETDLANTSISRRVWVNG